MRLIDADELKEDFKARLEKAKNWKENALNNSDDELVIRATATIDFICEVIMTINNAPTVEVSYLTNCANCERVEKIRAKRPQGTWDYEQVALHGVCSNCGAAVTSNLADIFLYEEIGKCPYNTYFCPNCGAAMGVARNDNS